MYAASIGAAREAENGRKICRFRQVTRIPGATIRSCHETDVRAPGATQTAVPHVMPLLPSNFEGEAGEVERTCGRRPQRATRQPYEVLFSLRESPEPFACHPWHNKTHGHRKQDQQ